MKVAIIGGGITGCMTAYYLARDKHHEVYLYESSSTLGGVLRDYQHNEDLFFNACQYLNTNADWFQELREDLDCEFNDFNHTYAGYTNVDGDEIFRNDFAGPILKSQMPIFDNQLECKWINLQNRFDCYGENISRKLTSFFKRCGHHPSDLDETSVIGLQMSRVFIENKVTEIIDIKTKLTLADNLLGLPRNILDLHSTPLLASLPQKGFNNFFDSMRALLISLGVQIYLSSPVRATKSTSNKSIRISSLGTDINYDLLIWCANPVPLMRSMNLTKLDNLHIKATCLHGFLDVDSDINPFYIQCYSDQSLIFRIYTYSLNNKPKVCIEYFNSEDILIEKICRESEYILERSGLSCRIHPCVAQKQKRHIVFTQNDLQIIEQFNTHARSIDIIGGAWQFYSRDQKIRNIRSSIKEIP